MKRIILTAWLVTAAMHLCGEVYWRGTPRQGGRSSGTRVVEGLLPGMEKLLYTREITVNGHKTVLEVSAVKGNIEDMVISLRKIKVDKLNISGGTIRFERKSSVPGMVERFLLIATRKNHPVSCFRVLVPEKLPAPLHWPQELPPLPPGAVITAVTRLGDESVCGEFRNASEPAYVQLRRVDSFLRGRKMTAASNEIASRDGGKGEIYFDKNAVIQVNFDDGGRGVFLYRRRK